MVSFTLEAAKSGQSVVRILSYNTEFCVCFTCELGELDRLAMHGTDGSVLGIKVHVLILVRNTCSFQICSAQWL